MIVTARQFGPERTGTNSEGYKDPTAGDAVRSATHVHIPHPGEVWTNSRGIDTLILLTHEWFSNILVLTDDTRRSYSIAGKRTEPALISYVRHDDLAEHVGDVSEKELRDVLDRVAEELDIRPVPAAEERLKQERDEAYDALASMRVRLDNMIKRAQEAASENVKLKNKLDASDIVVTNWRDVYYDLLDHLIKKEAE